MDTQRKYKKLWVVHRGDGGGIVASSTDKDEAVALALQFSKKYRDTGFLTTEIEYRVTASSRGFRARNK